MAHGSDASMSLQFSRDLPLPETLRIGKDGFSLPIELVTSTQAILARKRSGKSYTASVEAEELLRHKRQIATIDPTGAWWGLRSSAAGDGPGYPVVVFGGDHADVPLEPHAGRMLAQALVEHSFSAIFDVGSMVTEDQIRFTSDFTRELLRINRSALHLFIDEADTFAPQMVESKEQRLCLGAVSRLVKQGGIRGLGVTMISQRPADINKKVLSQVDVLTVLRMSHPLDITAATDWIKSEVSPTFAREVGGGLPSLPVGTAFVCSASLGIGERVEIRPRQTFNSGATPAPGENRQQPKVLAPIDIERLGHKIASSARHALENSPEFLRKRIVELEAAERNAGKVDSSQQLAELRAEIDRLRPLAQQAAALSVRLQEADQSKLEILAGLQSLIGRLEARPLAVSEVLPAKVNVPAGVQSLSMTSSLIQTDSVPNRSGEVVHTPLNQRTRSFSSAGWRRILIALAQKNSLSTRQIGLRAGLSSRSGTFATYLSKLRQNGYIIGSSESISITPAGLSALGSFDPLPCGPELLRYWEQELGEGSGASRILQVLYDAHPQQLSQEELGEKTKLSSRSGTFATYLSKLRTLQLIVGSRELTISNDLL